MSLYDGYVKEFGADIDIKAVDAWLNPDPNILNVLLAIFDDRRHPYYELVKAA